MKKIYAMIFVAAATLAGCQNVDENLNDGSENKLKLTATATTPEVSRTHLVLDGTTYKANWSEGDVASLIEIATAGEEVSAAKMNSNSVAEDCAVANFEFEVEKAEADKYDYVFAYPAKSVSGVSETSVSLILTTTQKHKAGSFGVNNDLLIATSLDNTTQPTNLNFNLTRLSAVGKMTLKNFAIPVGEVVEDVTFCCEQPISGKISVNIADLTWSVADGANSISTTNCVYSVENGGTLEVYFSALPATLNAGESYTITVETDKATYRKSATFPSNLVFEAATITTFSVNMKGAAVATAPATAKENLNENCEYAIGFTYTDGNVYLLPTTAVNRRPSGHKVGASGNGQGNDTSAYDLTNVSINNGSLTGELGAIYRWKVAKTESGLYNIYRTLDNGNTVYLIADGSDTSSFAIKAQNDDGTFSAQNGSNYQNTFDIRAREGGYDIVYAPEGSSPKYIYVYYTGTQYRIAQGSQGALNFYRIQAQSSFETATYPEVVTNSADVTDGTYVFLAKKADGSYYALHNDKSATETETRPKACLIGEETVGLTMNEDGTVASAANVKDQFKWVIVRTGVSTGWYIRSAVNSENYLWMRNANSGITIGTEAEAKVLKESFSCDWHFSDDATKGMQAQTPVAIANNFRVWADPSNGVWRCKESVVDTIILVKLSNSTSEIVTD